MNVMNRIRDCCLQLVQHAARTAAGSLARRFVWPAWVLLALAPMPGVSVTPNVATATFDEVWQQVRDTHYDYDRVREDWTRLRAPLRERAANAEDLEALRVVLAELLASLDESHYSILPAEVMAQGLDPDRESGADDPGSSAPGATGIRITLADDRLLVTRVEPDSPGARAGLDEGMTVISINGRALAEALEMLAGLEADRERRWARTFLQSSVQERIGWPDRNKTLKLVLTQIDGSELEAEVVPVASAAQTFRAGTLPPMRFRFDSERVERPAGHCIGRIEFTTWVPALGAALERALPPLLECRGLVIDLRGNLGGVMAMMMPAAGWLFDEVTTLGTMRNPAGEIHFRAFPKQVLLDGSSIDPFGGPVAVLVDATSASTSEMFAAGLQGSGRARVFGTRTPGMALPAHAMKLTSGDTLMYVMADYIGPHGKRIEGGGVVPDQSLTPTPATLAACGDPVLLAAFDWIEDRSGVSSCNDNQGY